MPLITDGCEVTEVLTTSWVISCEKYGMLQDYPTERKQHYERTWLLHMNILMTKWGSRKEVMEQTVGGEDQT